MDAKNYQLKTILDGTQQYMVPIYQREYSWRKPQWEQLWADIVGLDTDTAEDHHFLGSIVSKSFDSKAGGISKYLLIDGQQRLTTITVLLAAIRDLLRESDEENAAQTAEMIHELYLINRFRSGDDLYKVLPTKTDREAYSSLIVPTQQTGVSDTNITEAYRYFRKAILDALRDEPSLSLQKLQSTVTDQMEIVSITLGADDNDYRIFESLNATGMPLTQTDLLRNFFLMRIDDPKRQERIYLDLVRPITSEIDAVEGASSDTLFQYSLQRTGEYVRDKDVYAKWKRICDDQSPDELEATLREIHHDSRNYLKIIDPSREADPDVASRFRQLLNFGVMTPMPFLLNAMRWRDDGRINSDGLSSVLDLIQSFLVRRMFANVPTNALNRIFIRLSQQLPQCDDLVQATHVALSQPGLRWPVDAEFAESFPLYALYKDSRPGQRRVVLESLEHVLGHKEAPVLTGLTIEHVMPQTLTDDWRETLGSEASRVHSRWLHTIGNLTLTGYNSELHNDPFSIKRDRYRESNVQLTKQIASYDVWNEDSIQDRAGWLYALARKIWVGPADTSAQ
jgi:hypothetical protein